MKSFTVTARTRSLRSIFAWPMLVAALTAIGLVSALVGDDAWDVASWLMLATPIGVAAWYAARKSSRPSAAPARRDTSG